MQGKPRCTLYKKLFKVQNGLKSDENDCGNGATMTTQVSKINDSKIKSESCSNITSI